MAAGVVLSGLTLVMLVVGVVSQGRDGAGVSWTAPPAVPAGDARAAGLEGMTRGLGVELMTRWVVGFELAAVLLTAAVVGAIALARPVLERRHAGGPEPAEAVVSSPSGEPAEVAP
jgi:NADH:ubiquinone oxidoreductase subunit 6 (subunit J)